MTKIHPRLACALPPTTAITDHAIHAERLGYHRLWLFDAPALYGDLWVALTRAATSTARIALAAGVAVPGLRHPMVTASAAASIAEIAPGRLTVAFGAGQIGRRTLGRPPVRVAALAREVRQVRSLLAGEVVEIDGKPCQLLQLPDAGPARPIDVPVWMAADGPRMSAAAREIGVPGVLVTSEPTDPYREVALLRFGTVLRPGEDHRSARVIEAAGPGWAFIAHSAWQQAGIAVDGFPGGKHWRNTIEGLRPENERHLAVYEGHLSLLTDRDRDLVVTAGPALMGAGWVGSPAGIHAHITTAAAAGVTEIVYLPCGPDIVGELEAFAEVFHGCVSPGGGTELGDGAGVAIH
ncbi:LLM class flavin-dependent oxidoreductase [Nocardia sp. ET3-3]|uniref:LLM class flavin-dependent oxidoreductase n=1 Tax=Nocardia terrae TaxID=2675851 RepID=A0A7K1V652_9NOCA|nr:LLM class flavin-dependent oxidoreductase [Nocardia terrae]MVU82114.1 LLM class flavin-dependent oxidoreductase [Nocardia terrae]